MGKDSTDTNNVFAILHHLVELISDVSAIEEEAGIVFKELMTLFPFLQSVSSLELLQSSMIDGCVVT